MNKEVLIAIIAIILVGGGIFAWYRFIREPVEEKPVEEMPVEKKEEIKTWKYTFGGEHWDAGHSVQQTTDGGFIITGDTRVFGVGGVDVWLIKTDSEGNKEWESIFGGEHWDAGHSVQQTADGGFIITGLTKSFGAGEGDVWLIKTDSEGNKEWENTFGGEYLDVGHSVQQTADGGFIITGETGSFGVGGDDVWLIKTDSEGNKEWENTFGGEHWDGGHSVQQTTDGGFIITGDTRVFSPGGADVWLIKTDSEGNKEWESIFGGEYLDAGYSVQQTTDGGFIITGETGSFGAGEGDVWLIKTDSEGNEEWRQTFGGEYLDRGSSVQQTTDGGFIIAGETRSFGPGGADLWLIKTDSEGNKEWESIFGGEYLDAGYSVQQTTDGGFIITGLTMSFGVGRGDLWLIKTDSEGRVKVNKRKK
jgi:predicted secreted protein